MEMIHRDKINQVTNRLLLQTATMYPLVFLEKILAHYQKETDLTAKSVLRSIIENILLASEKCASICQDTGVPTFHVSINPDQKIEGYLTEAITESVIESTNNIPLRKNVIEPFSFVNSGNNTGWGVPLIHYHYDHRAKGLGIRAELKGFGGEIKSTYDWVFTSAKSMENAALVFVINSVLLSKGEPCPPSFIGVGAGGYGADVVSNARDAILRELNDKANTKLGSTENDFLSRIEKRFYKCINGLGLGPMGVGGNTTTLGTYLVRCGTQTAAAPVAVNHQCWANRASEAWIHEDKVDYITRHVEPTHAQEIREKIESSGDEQRGRTHEIWLPLESNKLAELKIGDVVYLTGRICTARDGAHRRMVGLMTTGKENEIPREILDCGAIYHCGPIVQEQSGKWIVNSAGPTTSSRFTEEGAYLVDKGIINVVVGKGTMGSKMVESMRGKAVYLKATGGCAVCYANAIEDVDVKWLELGHPEAVWVFDVKRLGPLIVGIDSDENSLSSKVMEKVFENAYRIYEEEGLDPQVRYFQNPLTLAGLSLEDVIQICRKE